MKNRYSDEQLKKLATMYCKVMGRYIPSLIEIENVDEENVLIHLYDIVNNHAATSDWYSVSRYTGKGTNALEEPIDISLDGIIELIDFGSSTEEINKIKEAFAKDMANMPYFREDDSVKTRTAFDLDNDGKKEYIFITDYYAENNLFIYSSDGVRITGGLDEIYGVVTSCDIREGKDGPVILAITGMADGLCYESEEIYEIEYKNGEIKANLLAKYACDSEKEAEIRGTLEHQDGSPLTPVEEEVLYGKAHTLKYMAGDKVITLEEYEKILTDYENTHKPLKEIL